MMKKRELKQRNNLIYRGIKCDRRWTDSNSEKQITSKSRKKRDKKREKNKLNRRKKSNKHIGNEKIGKKKQ